MAPMRTARGTKAQASYEQGRLALASVRRWPPRRWLVAAGAALLTALFIGVPTVIVPTGLFTRMTPVTWWDYPVWAISALLVGLTAATYVRDGYRVVVGPDRSRRAPGAIVLSGLAVGCPVCNKLVVALIGISGALNYWAPLQPVLGVLSIMLLLTGLAVRLRGQVACPSPTR